MVSLCGLEKCFLLQVKRKKKTNPAAFVDSYKVMALSPASWRMSLTLRKTKSKWVGSCERKGEKKKRNTQNLLYNEFSLKNGGKLLVSKVPNSKILKAEKKVTWETFSLTELSVLKALTPKDRDKSALGLKVKVDQSCVWLCSLWPHAV